MPGPKIPSKKSRGSCRSGYPSFDAEVEAGSSRAEPIETVRHPSPNPDQKGETTMRVMVIVKASKDSEAGLLPKQRLPAEMGKNNEDPGKTPRLLAAQRLPARSKAQPPPFPRNTRPAPHTPSPNS